VTGRKQPLPEATTKSYMYQLCKALDHMHKNGIFHRDIKPENILLKGVCFHIDRLKHGHNLIAAGRHSEACRLWVMSRYLLQASFHRIHCNTMVYMFVCC
jgi:tRNA A-37 threonylcarbamoyl transferase component Bud32